MMNNPASVPEKKWMAVLQRAGKKILKTLTHNWGLKLTCLLLALFLWSGLISQDTTLPRVKVLDNVKITVVGESTLRQNGMIVVDGLEKLPSVRLQVQVPQNNYNVASASHYSVRLDLSQIKEPGVQTIKLTATPVNTSLYGNVLSMSTQEVTVNVMQYTTRNRIPVQVNVRGAAPEGLHALYPTINPDLVEIAGPQALVDSVARCIVDYDMDSLALREGRNVVSLPFVLEDHQGHIIDSQYITVSSQAVTLKEIVVEQTLYPVASVPVSTKGLIEGQPMEGYEVTGISIFPENVKLAAEDVSLYLEEGAMLLPLSPVSIAGASQDVVGTIHLDVPDHAAYMSAISVAVTVTIAPANEGRQP